MKESKQLILIVFALFASGGLFRSFPLWQDLVLNWPSPLHDIGVLPWFLLAILGIWAVLLMIIGVIVTLCGVLVGRNRNWANLVDRMAQEIFENVNSDPTNRTIVIPRSNMTHR